MIPHPYRLSHTLHDDPSHRMLMIALDQKIDSQTFVHKPYVNEGLLDITIMFATISIMSLQFVKL